MTHLLNNNIISLTQYAFRPNSSTTAALQSVINNIYKHTTKYKPTIAIYVDLSKAYDTISHTKLLHKLQHEFNFNLDTLEFFKTYFQNRQQSVHTTRPVRHTHNNWRNTAGQHSLSHNISPLHQQYNQHNKIKNLYICRRHDSNNNSRHRTGTTNTCTNRTQQPHSILSRQRPRTKPNQNKLHDFSPP